MKLDTDIVFEKYQFCLLCVYGFQLYGEVVNVLQWQCLLFGRIDMHFCTFLFCIS